ncbi:MAG: hypothetical protein JO316_08130 [Abitibacteriaceae bacterium]|nr:hypothetical protein [Abditibacteriaceae bacterium]MBV9865301.1 hypothetical protein [Abditibacteriaceae bacterium]
MAVTAHQIAAYRFHFYGHSQSADDTDRKAEIFLISTENSAQGPLVGRLMFYEPEVAATKQDRIDENGRTEAHLSIVALDAVLNVLRNEKPLTIMYDDQCQLAWLASSQEPVGEGEYK